MNCQKIADCGNYIANLPLKSIIVICNFRGATPWGTTQLVIANALVFKKVRLALGLERCKIAISAAAPIMKDTLEFFMSLNIPVTEMYGMSESTGTLIKAQPLFIKTFCELVRTFEGILNAK